MIIGRVSGVVGPRQAADVRGEAWGLDVAVQDVGHGPERMGRTVEVFEFNLSASCRAVGMGKEELLARFPPGSEVRVAAKRSQRAWTTEGSDGMILEGGPFNRSTVVSRILPREPISASFASVHDFASPIDIASYEESHGAAADWFWYQGMVRFELLKELLRLTRAEDEGEVVAILERIRRIPLASRGEVSYPALVRTYLEDPSKAKALIGEGSEP